MACVFTRLGWFFVILCCFEWEISARGQKKGFRGGDKGYGIKIEATSIGTNLQYKLPEAKAKSSSPTDWQVDNDNAEMVFAMNSPILANVIVTNPKFSVKGQWPGYKTTLKLPKGVKTGSKKNELARLGDQGSGSGDESVENEESISGSGNAEDENGKDSGSASGSFKLIEEGSEEQEHENTISDSHGFGSAEDRDYNSKDNLEILHSKSESEQKKERRSNVDKNSLKQNESEELRDLSFEKVKLAVESLRHFNLKDPRTSKALKDIITHAKKVVKEAKMVLNDVASVVTSVRDFVNGNFNSEDKDSKTNNSVLGIKNDSENSVIRAREEAEKAALQARYAARRAQAASEMARKFASKIWNSAKTSETFGKPRSAVVVKEISRKEEISEQNIKKVLGNVLKSADKVHAKYGIESQKKNVTQGQHRYGNQSVAQVKHYQGNQKTANVSHSTLKFVVKEQKGNHSDRNVLPSHKDSITNKENEGIKKSKNAITRKKSDHNKKDSTQGLSTNVQKENNEQIAEFEAKKRKDADKSQANHREAMKVANLEKLLKESLHKTREHKDAKKSKTATLTGRKSKKTPKISLPWQHPLPGDANEVVKNTEAKSTLKSILSSSTLTRKKDKRRKGEKQIEIDDDDGDVTSGDDVSDDYSQSGSTISGSYDIELELEPDKLEFVKGEGKMNEKRIKIKDLSANGERNKVPSGTSREILKAIKRVEGVLGFTIEKTKPNKKKSHIHH